MPSIKIKNNNHETAESLIQTRIKLWSALGLHKINPWKINNGKDCFYAVLNEDGWEKMMRKEVKDELQKINLEIITPPEYRASRTILARNIDKQIDVCSEEEIKISLKEENPWMTIENINVFKTGPVRCIKIVLENNQQVQRAMTNGILIKSQSIPSNNIEKEIYCNIDTCYNCYSYEHKTRDCDKEVMIICTNCSQVGHKYNNCKEPPQCINCKQAHKTLAAKCPIRKELIKEKVKKIKDNEKKKTSTYADATKKQSETSTGQLDLTSKLKIPENAITTILSAIVISNMEEATQPGSFQKTMDSMYALNGLQKVKFPKDLNHRGFLQLMGVTPPTQNIGELKEIEEEAEKEKEDLFNILEDIEEGKDSDNEHSNDEANSSESDEEEKETCKSTKMKRKRDVLTPSPVTIQTRGNHREKKIKEETERKLKISEEEEEEVGITELNRLKLTLYIPKAYRLNTNTEEDQQKIVELFLNDKAKASWKAQEWRKANILELISNNKKVMPQYIKFKKIDDEAFKIIKTGYVSK